MKKNQENGDKEDKESGEEDPWARHKAESEAIIAEFQKSEDSQEGAPFKADNSLLRPCMAELRNVLQDPKCYVT